MAASTLFTVPGQALAAPAEPAPAKAGAGAVAAPDQALGAGWRGSSDVLVTGSGDTDGYHLFVAREKDAFAWKTLATLTSSALEVGPWMGEVCVTGSGRYAVAVFAPKKASNKPELMRAGGLAAVVDTTTGKATHVATGVQLSYFNPGCGPGDTALLTRAIGEDFDRDTELLTLDAAAAKVTRTRRIDGRIAMPAPAPDGDYAVAGNQLVKVGATGKVQKVAKLNGQAFGLRATTSSGIDIVSVRDKQAVAERFSAGKLVTTATGPLDKLQLFAQRGGGNALVGQVTTRAAVPQLTVIASSTQVETVSAQGHLLAESVYSRQAAKAVAAPLTMADTADSGAITIKVRAVASGRETSGVVIRTPAPELNVDVATAPDKGVAAKSTVRAAVSAAAVGEPGCAVPRNDPSVQPLQPSPDQVEWAIDQAVHGRLMVTRPANYLKSGLASYQPQQLFPRKSLVGGGTVPANVLLGIVAQETNMSQASWHVVPGDTGNPLVGSYYGNAGNLDYINYDEVDCGYGIGQVTDGMRTGAPQWSYAQKRAIAIDYAANIAASLNILIEKWNQLNTEPSAYQSWMNDNSPSYIENWFFALWAYNSGFYPYANRNTEKQKGYWGVGWLNNPANNEYPANRLPFLRHTMADAEHPNRWSYPERIMGWVESPQYKGYPVSERAYSQPEYGVNGPTGPSLGHVLPLPDRFAFCSTVNNCSEAANGCPWVSEACWWYGPAISADCRDDECSREKLAFALGSPEPGVKRIYDRECDTFNEWKNPQRDATKKVSVVFNLNNTGQYALGCDDVGAQNGKFTLRLGDPAGSPETAPYAAIDLHQIGAGYKGHSWFTYQYRGEPKRKIVGSWTPELDLAPGTRTRFDVVVHLPSHGADAEEAEYVITTGSPVNSITATCLLNPYSETQSSIPGVLGKGKWVYLGAWDMGRGAQVQLSNVATPVIKGRDSVAWDAVAFIPIGSRQGHKCRDDYEE